MAIRLVVLLQATAPGCASGPGDSVSHPTLPSGEQVLVILVTASWSRGKSDSEFGTSIRSLLESLPREAEQRGVALSLVGAALDVDPDLGYRILRRFGRFNQVLTGDGWLNLAAVEYIWRDHPGDPAVPQVIVVRRRVDSQTSSIAVGADSVLGRFLGAREIIDYARQERHF